MNKRELIKATANRANVSQKVAESVIMDFLTVIQHHLDEGVSIREFGTFTIERVAAHTGRNPRTGESLSIPEGKRVKFKASDALLEYSDVISKYSHENANK